jgi:hypothetical protein
MARRHALQLRQVKPDDGLLLVDDDWHAHLAGAPNHFVGCLPIHDIALLERDSPLD